ncbi:MAG: Flp pilus assembly protein CpaB [Paracoccaceae bacterium]
MRIIFSLILLMGLGLAGSAAYMVMQRFTQYEAELTEQRRLNKPAIELTEIAVAAKNLLFSTQITADDVRMQKWPADAVPETAYTTIEALLGDADARPRVVLRRMVKDEVVLVDKVSDFGRDAGILSRLPSGSRAFTLSVGMTTGVSSNLRPNDRVDIYWTGNNGRATITKILLENIRLVAVDQITDEDAIGSRTAKTITVEIDPQLVALLTQAQQSGRLTLSFRGLGDSTTTSVEEVNTRDVTGVTEVFVQPEVAAEVCYRIEMKGIERIKIQVTCADEE